MEEKKKEIRYVGVKENLFFALANGGQCFSYNMFTGSYLSLFFVRVFGIPTGAVATMLLVLGICCSTLAYAGYNLGVRVLGASEACVFNNAIPVFSLIAAIIIRQETFSWSNLGGMAIVIAGVVLAQFEPRSKSATT